MLKGVNWAGWIAALVVGQVIGIVWYGMLFEQMWTELSGVSTESGDPMMSMVLGVVNSAVLLLGMSWAFGKMGVSGYMDGAKAGLFLGVFFALTTVSLGFIYGGVNTGLIPIDFGYMLLIYVVSGALLAGLKFGKG